MTYLFVRRKDSKTRASRFVLIRSSQGPESNRPATKLCEPAFKLRLSCIMREAIHMKNFGSLFEEGIDISPSIHWSAEDFRVLMLRLRLADETT